MQVFKQVRPCQGSCIVCPAFKSINKPLGLHLREALRLLFEEVATVCIVPDAYD